MADNDEEWDDDEFIMDACILGAVVAISELTYSAPRQKCWTSTLSGHKWISDLIRGNRIKSLSILRMEKCVFIDLCNELSTKYGLVATREVGLREMVAIFIYIVAQGVSTRAVQDRFQHSGEKIHRQFHRVLDSIIRMSRDIIKPRDPEFSVTPRQITENDKYNPFFNDCIGAIDGTHIAAVVPPDQRIPYIGRKGVTTQNVMAVCDFDMLFTFVCGGWEGSAHDSRIFNKVLSDAHSNFPHPPTGKYYLVDAGYPNQRGYLAPYKGQRYHLEVFRNGPQPTSPREAFNHTHSSLRSIIERTFGVMKKKWLILTRMPSYKFCTQVKIVVACMALHNFIRRHVIEDEDFIAYGNESMVMGNDDDFGTSVDVGEPSHFNEDLEMTTLRDMIAAELYDI
ncbi:protein ANTAGONIST OF LIKE HETEROCHROMATIN PROTEIN 1-like [Tripterygium wilfordii]|uniref:protein ANTAGONIST OF LIKE HETEROCHROMATIN PROTEIN 1-like n=1 Tax=Tripterygium wilfordii TaxID=458696 RepID=UPI0018F81427|nr:protein ANTAGONIST OF LIKE HETEROCHROMATIN PROTEIN 1-like [Tripterygium wilfordii]